MSFFKKSGPSPEEVIREKSIIKSITENFKAAVKILQQEFISSDDPIHSEDTANAVCNVLEAVFLHGLKDSFSTKAFWSFLQKFTHRDVVSQLNHLGQITTEVGMCRAWIRLSLNDGVLESYLDAMLADTKTLESYYRRFAYLRDVEHPGILKSYVQGLANFTFQLSYNSSVLNIWTTTPLILAGLQDGLYTPPAVVHPRHDVRSRQVAGRPAQASTAAATQPYTAAITTTTTTTTTRSGRRRPKSHRTGARVINAISYPEQSSESPAVPQNTPIDPSQLTTHDIEEIRKLTLLHKKSEGSSSTATSLISHPDPVDARQNFALPFQATRNAGTPQSLPSGNVEESAKEGQTLPVVRLFSSQGADAQSGIDGETGATVNRKSVPSKSEAQVLEEVKTNKSHTGECNGKQVQPPATAEPTGSIQARKHTPNLMDSDTDVQDFNLKSSSLTLTPGGQSQSQIERSKPGSSPGRIRTLFPSIKSEDAPTRKSEDAPTIKSEDVSAGKEIDVPDSTCKVSSPQTNGTQLDTEEFLSSSPVADFSVAIRRKSAPLDPVMSSVTATTSDIDKGHKEDPNAENGEEESAPDSFEPDDPNKSPVGVQGNSLGMMEGWSSNPFEEKTDLEAALQGEMDSGAFWEQSDRLQMSTGDESFNQLLESYGPSAAPLDAPTMSQVLETLPESQRHGLVTAPVSPPVTQPSTHTTDLDEVSEDYEVLPDIDEINSMPVDPRTQTFLEIVGDICTERGLDYQNYQCQGCGRPVGMFYGKARVCTYDASYYCYSCHENEEYYIPSRVLHNWDFRKHRVSKQSLIFLRQHEEDPLLDVDSLNARIYHHVNEMNEVKLLREQLRYLKTYLFSCKQSIAEDLRRQVWPREYLYDDVHLYSLADLLQVPSGSLAQSVRKAIKFASKHVYECRLCCQKGFICEICNSSKVIYPFEMDSTTRCDRCSAVYHRECKTSSRPCPKCERRRQRHTNQGEEDNTADSTECLDYAISPDSGLQLSDEVT